MSGSRSRASEGLLRALNSSSKFHQMTVGYLPSSAAVASFSSYEALCSLSRTPTFLITFYPSPEIRRDILFLCIIWLVHPKLPTPVATSPQCNGVGGGSDGAGGRRVAL